MLATGECAYSVVSLWPNVHCEVCSVSQIHFNQLSCEDCGCICPYLQMCVEPSRANRLVQILQPAMEGIGKGFEAGPALFGPDMTPSAFVRGPVVKAEPFQACEPLDTASAEVKGHVALVQRGGCSFMKKVWGVCVHVRMHACMCACVHVYELQV